MEFPYEAFSPFASLEDAVFNHYISLGAGALWTGSVVLRSLGHLRPSRCVWWHVPLLMLAFSTAIETIKSSEGFCCPPEEVGWICCAYALERLLLHLHEVLTVVFLLVLVQSPGVALGGISFNRAVDRLPVLGVFFAIAALSLDSLSIAAFNTGCLDEAARAAYRAFMQTAL